MIPGLTIFFKIFVHLVSELTYGTRNDYTYLLEHTMYHEQNYLPDSFTAISCRNISKEKCQFEFK